MSKKKKQSNGFFLFMRDMQMDLRESGRNVPMRDMPLLAGPKWAKLPDREKAVYNARAKAERKGAGAAPGGAGLMHVPPSRGGRMDCTGELLSVSLLMYFYCIVHFCTCIFSTCIIIVDGCMHA